MLFNDVQLLRAFPCKVFNESPGVIDNTGALAAMVKAYARAIDSARIVHAFAALAVTLNISPWFEYVRTKANVADLPSREGLQGYAPLRGHGVRAKARLHARRDAPTAHGRLGVTLRRLDQ